MGSSDLPDTARSWPQVALGALIALALPLTYLILAKLIDNGTVRVPPGSLNDLLKSLGLNASAGIALALLGIWTAGRGARLTSRWAWLALVAIALPVLSFVWFMTYATLGGATGSPF
jgi:hypothetical protein